MGFARVAAPACGGREIDDRSRPALQHRAADHLARAEHRGGQINRDGGVPVIQRLFPDIFVLTRRGRVVQQDVDLPEFAEGPVDHGANIVLAGHIAAHANGAFANGGGLLHHQLFAPGGHQHLGALLHKQPGHHRAASGAGPGDNGHFASKPA